MSERFWAKVRMPAQPNDCLEWMGAIVTGRSGGYGHLKVSGRYVRAHRFAYELLVGPIPLGMVLDHLCRNRSCVNVNHLEVVDVQTNNRRRYGWTKTHCGSGHDITQPRALKPAATGVRCRECENAGYRRRYAERAAA